MQKLTMLIAAVAMTTLFAQANDVEKMEATVDLVMQDAKSMAPAPQKDVTPETEEDKNNTQEEEKYPSPFQIISQSPLFIPGFIPGDISLVYIQYIVLSD